MLLRIVVMTFVLLSPLGAYAQRAERLARTSFRWVNPLTRTDLAGVRHATFRSPSMDCDVGYCIYLPPDYESPKSAETRYPTVYYLHGGRPGGETRGVAIAKYVHEAIARGEHPPCIYVFVNGGPVSHYNLPDQPEAQGETVFVKELIPHIDKTYRTIADRSGRGLEGFSQGGRGTARIMFKHPELFCSASSGGGGHATEKRIAESGGVENPNLKFARGDNTWDLAREYAGRADGTLKILLYVGGRDFNYEANLEYSKHLRELKIPHELLVVPDTPHSATGVYDRSGKAILTFHARNFGAAK